MPQESQQAKPKNLILVPGHAVYIGTQLIHTEQDQYWAGRFGYYGEARLYVEHAAAGVFLANADKSSILLFSGGQTRTQAGMVSEALGYLNIVLQREWDNHPEVKDRTRTEEFARDSFENLEFSLLRFQQLTGALPERVTVCGFGFKEERYRFHAQTIGNLNFNYVAVNEPPRYVLEGGSLQGEEDTMKLFGDCPRGDKGKLLEKRLQRDPFVRGNPYQHR